MSLSQKEEDLLFKTQKVQKGKNQFLFSSRKTETDIQEKAVQESKETSENELLSNEIDSKIAEVKNAIEGTKKIIAFINKDKSYKIDDSETELKKALKEEFGYSGSEITWDIYQKALKAQKEYLNEAKNEISAATLI